MKAIIPVAGLGTRMLPATKAIPKEMFPIIDKPIIQYIVEEAINSGFKEIILVTHASKNSIENHFDKSFELETTLEKRLRRSSLKELKNIADLDVKISSIRQGEALGLGHAVACAEKSINDEYFAVILPDRIMSMHRLGENKNLKKMRNLYKNKGYQSLLIEEIKPNLISSYGAIEFDKSFDSKKDINRINGVVEKPQKNRAPSFFAVVGRYILSPEIFKYIPKATKSSPKEIELTDAIQSMILSGQDVHSVNLEGKCFDCGSLEGYFEAILEFGLQHKSLSKSIRKMINNV